MSHLKPLSRSFSSTASVYYTVLFLPLQACHPPHPPVTSNTKHNSSNSNKSITRNSIITSTLYVSKTHVYMEADVAVKETVGNLNVSIILREQEHGYTDNYSVAKHSLELECKRTVTKWLLALSKPRRQSASVWLLLLAKKSIILSVLADRIVCQAQVCTTRFRADCNVA